MICCGPGVKQAALVYQSDGRPFCWSSLTALIKLRLKTHFTPPEGLSRALLNESINLNSILSYHLKTQLMNSEHGRLG